MRDGFFLLLMAGFFALAGAYVRACALIIGPDGAQPVSPDPAGHSAGTGADDDVAAGVSSGGAGSSMSGSHISRHGAEPGQLTEKGLRLHIGTVNR